MVSLTESMSRWLAGRLGGAAPELQVIPNPLPSHAQARSPLDQKTFVTAGRLAPEKQFEHVVDAFWRIHEDLPGWTLRIFGDGPRADNLRAQVRKLGLEDRVELPGAVDDLAAEWARASVAVLASRGEGYPLVLQEAMSAGVPAISYDCPSGPREIITHDVDGLLVPPASKAALAAAMLRVATDDDLRARLGEAALTRSERWDGQALARRWVDTFRTAVERRHDPLAPRRVLHGLRPGPLGDLPETTSARGLTPAEARTTTLRVLTSVAAATGDGWFVLPARGLDPHPVVVVPSSRREAFLAALAQADVPDWLSVRDPAERGWPERRGTVAAMTDELSRTRTASFFLEPWPMRGGHDGLLGEGVEVGVQLWEETPEGDLLAPGLNRYGDRVPAGTARTTTVVDGLDVPTLATMALPTVDDCRFEVDVVYTWVDGDDEDWLAARDERIRSLGGTPDKRASGAARYRSRDELRYSMRSIHLFAPWVRRIHLVTAGQVPDWLDRRHDRIRVVDHRDILPASALPTFSSHAIETALHRVPDLADHFVYVNDDVFLGRPRRKEHFFTPGGQYAAFVADHRAVGLPGTDDRPYLSAAQNNRRVLQDAFGGDHPDDDAQPAPPAAYDAGGGRGPLRRRGGRDGPRAVPLRRRPVAAVVVRAELRAGHRPGVPRRRAPRLRRPRPPAAAGAAALDAQARPRLLLRGRQPRRRVRRRARRPAADGLPAGVLPRRRALGAVARRWSRRSRSDRHETRQLPLTSRRPASPEVQPRRVTVQVEPRVDRVDRLEPSRARHDVQLALVRRRREGRHPADDRADPPNRAGHAGWPLLLVPLVGAPQPGSEVWPEERLPEGVGPVDREHRPLHAVADGELLAAALDVPGRDVDQPAHVPSTRLPSASQCDSTFFDGCTRGGSPGIFGWSGG